MLNPKKNKNTLHSAGRSVQELQHFTSRMRGGELWSEVMITESNVYKTFINPEQ